MSDFNLDQFKNTWQEQSTESKYSNEQITKMLNHKSRSYVKYILWISVVEFIFFVSLTIFYIFSDDDSNSYLNIIEKLGVERNVQLIADFSHLYFLMKIIGLLVTAIFVYKFYRNYMKIKVISNLKKFILQIIRFKKTVNLFIVTNIILMVIFTAILTIFVFYTVSEQKLILETTTKLGILLIFILTTLFSTALIWLYYRLVYGIVMKKLSKNLQQLKEIEEPESN